MIDTIKIISMISKKNFEIIRYSSDIKTSYNSKLGQTFYTIINGHIQGKYNSSISVRVGDGSKYNFTNNYYIEIEGSYHKLVKGYNSHNGFCNLQVICINLIKIVENAYKVKLPTYNHWFLQRVDISICFNLKNQENIKLYINNLSQCNFPKRNLKYYENESIYIPGSTTTLKIYNKLLEFKNNDLKNFKDTDFDLYSYLNQIQGYIRFECEIKKAKLKHSYKKKYIRVNQVFYNELKNIWYFDFKRLLKYIESNFKLLRSREDVKFRLKENFSPIRAKHLFDFYILTLARGINEMRKDTDRTSYYKNIKDLKKCGIDFSQKLGAELNNEHIDFNPFEAIEIE